MAIPSIEMSITEHVKEHWKLYTIITGITIIVVTIIAVAVTVDFTKKSENQLDAVEGFISSGSEGSAMRNGAVIGPNIYSNQIIQNGKDWNSIVDSVKKDGTASDGPGTLGAAKGKGFDESMKNQKKYNQYMDKNVTVSTEEMNKVTRAINSGIDNSLGDISMYNRGSQVKGNLIIQSGLNSTVGMLDEKYYSERQKNRNIYTVTKAVHIKGFDVNPENMGAEFGNYKPAKVLNRKGKKVPNIADATKNNNGVSVQNGKLVIENDKSKVTTDMGAKNKSDGVIQAKTDNGTMVGVRSTKA